MNRTRYAGFTLIETVVVVAITSFILVALGILIAYFYRTNAYVLQQTEAVDSARRSVENAVRDLREASYGADGSYPVAAAATSTVTFYAYIPADNAVDRVRYFLDGTTLYRGTTAPAGTPLSYAGQTEKTTLVIDNIRNGTSTPLFTYYDAQGNELPTPVDVANIASVRIEALTDVNPYRAPDVYTLEGGATLRNLHNMNE